MSGPGVQWRREGFWQNTFVSNTREKATAGSGVQKESTLPQPGLTRPFFFYIQPLATQFIQPSLWSKFWPLEQRSLWVSHADKMYYHLRRDSFMASSNRSKYPFLLSTQGPVSYTRLAGCCHSATPSCDLLWWLHHSGRQSPRHLWRYKEMLMQLDRD